MDGTLRGPSVWAPRPGWAVLCCGPQQLYSAASHSTTWEPQASVLNHLPQVEFNAHFLQWQSGAQHRPWGEESFLLRIGQEAGPQPLWFRHQFCWFRKVSEPVHHVNALASLQHSNPPSSPMRSK